MAGFKTHLIGGGVVGSTSASYAMNAGGAEVWQLACLAALGLLAGILPDLDSDTGRPIKLLFALVSTLVVVVTDALLLSSGSGLIVVCGATVAAYLACLIFFYICKRLTVHRGIMHSIFFALLAGSLVAIVFSPWGERLSIVAGLTTVGGVLTHLVLDELNSIGVRFGLVPYIKSSFGSALKLTGKSVPLTLVLFGMLFVLSTSYLIVN